MRKILIYAILNFLPILTVLGADIYVGPSELFTTIQPAVNASQNGDTIWVRDGTYLGSENKNITFNGKQITVRSVNGAEFCVIDCQDNGRGFDFSGNETALSVVKGFSIINGQIGFFNGGGMVCYFSSPTILDCHFENNRALFGAGIECDNSQAIIVNCRFIANIADVANPQYGAEGGGIDCYFSSPQIINCLFVSNFAKSFGGGINCETSHPHVINCTFSGNICEIGNGICGRSSSPTITNCIIWSDTPESVFFAPGNPNINFCNIHSGYYPPGQGNIQANPGFIEGPLGQFYLSHTATGQPENSPCINAGSQPASELCFLDTTPYSFCIDSLGTRIDGIADSDVVDMGYHYPSGTIPTPTPTPSCIHHGDVNQDGNVTAGDAQLTFQIALGLFTPSFEQQCQADCDGSGIVTAGDAQQVFMAALGVGNCIH